MKGGVRRKIGDFMGARTLKSGTIVVDIFWPWKARLLGASCKTSVLVQTEPFSRVAIYPPMKAFGECYREVVAFCLECCSGHPDHYFTTLLEVRWNNRIPYLDLEHEWYPADSVQVIRTGIVFEAVQLAGRRYRFTSNGLPESVEEGQGWIKVTGDQACSYLAGRIDLARLLPASI